MKIKAQIQIDDGPLYNFECEEKELFRRDVENLLKSPIPSLLLKFGDSGNVVNSQLVKVKNV